MSNLPYGSTVGEFEVLHSGNHNELAKPHIQYDIPVFYIKTADSYTQNYYAKIATTPIISSANTMRFNFVAYVFSDAGSSNYDIEGTLTVTIESDTMAYASFYNKNKLKSSYAPLYDLCRVYKRVVTGGVVFDVYFKAPNINEYLKFTPVACIFTSAYYNNPTENNRTISLFLNKQDLVDGSTISGTLLCSSTVENSIITLPDLSDITSLYNDKIVKTEDGHFGYVQSGVFNEFIQRAKTITITNTTTTPDVANNTSSINLTQSSAVNITNFANGVEGQVIQLLASNGNSTLIYDNTKIKTKTGADTTIPIYKTVMLRRFNAVWFEFFRDF